MTDFLSTDMMFLTIDWFGAFFSLMALGGYSHKLRRPAAHIPPSSRPTLF